MLKMKTGDLHRFLAISESSYIAPLLGCTYNYTKGKARIFIQPLLQLEGGYQLEEWL